MIKIPKKQLYRIFSVKKGEKGKKFKRYTSYGKTLIFNEMGKNSFKSDKGNKDRYYIRSVKRGKDRYEIYLRKKVK